MTGMITSLEQIQIAEKSATIIYYQETIIVYYPIQD